MGQFPMVMAKSFNEVISQKKTPQIAIPFLKSSSEKSQIN
jgi:hypothetical protein